MTGPSKEPKVVLVVENNLDVLELLGDMVSDQGWEPITATTLKAALASLASRTVDAIIADIELDDGNSIPLLMKAHECLPRPVPAFAISSYASDNLKREVMKLGAIDLLPKPFRLDELATRLAQQLESIPSVM